MEPWQQSLRDSLTDPAQLTARFAIDPVPLLAVAQRYPLRITPYYLDLLEGPGDPLWRQCVPDPAELEVDGLLSDPLCETRLSPVPGLVHRYPDRALLLTTATCAVYCRFCTRKRAIGCSSGNQGPDFAAALSYIAQTPALHEVILSGGDPLLLDDDRLDDLLSRLRAIPHVETIRIHSRVPVVLPERITERLAALLGRHHPLYLNTHFNHPRELTPEAAEACQRLAAAGIPLGNQSVLLRGVNDDAETLRSLFRGLLRLRVRPYYLHHGDLVAGTAHLRTSIESGLSLVAALRNTLPGMAIPQYVIDLPGGRGKMPLLANAIVQLGPTAIIRAANGENVAVANPGRNEADK
ncbi:MAG: lysine 2,3-aminomutase [Deltaproteobacteria bacterium HGW-Deltaproteobacteria-4]|nr:MAG: lysine 2,3-aminomutase [Deltaproteobacteria bacterium HGW-Deltaproteobacteria-4]